ncbi:methionyl-tRNA formyltransferase [Candidatus Gracilibacteria bacterium]|nr:methionyl-tRNA formyltransferase [Candidatus Gracilibacteria bacterium]
MKIIFFGTPSIALPSLELLNSIPGTEILAVFTQPDRPVGRKKELTAPPVKELAKELNLKVIQPQNKAELEEELSKFEADFFIVIAYGMIFSEKVLSMPKKAAINVHYSLLPKYRGASPVQEAILNGDKETGIAFQKMAKKLDAGDLYLLERMPIAKEDNTESLMEKLAHKGAELLPFLLEDIFDNDLEPVAQNHKNATFCKKISKEDGKIDWKQSAEQIKNKMRAYAPWPGVFTEHNGKKLKIIEADLDEETFEAGKFKLEEKILKIGTSHGSLIPKKVQPEGKQAMEISAFINGYL